MAEPSSNQPQVSPLKKRGGIWTVIGVLLVAGIVTVGYLKYFADSGDEGIPETAYTPPKHLIVISIDTLRADHLGCYGYSRPTSPSMDALAKEGVVFERHYTCYPLTLPSHLTQLTGVSSLGHRVRDNLYHSLPGELQTLPEVMKAQGFKTGAFVSAHTMKGGSGLERGFDVYDDRDVRAIEPGRLTVRERKAPETFKLAADWIAGQGSDRFFCYVHLFDPHAPYEPHNDLGDAFQGDTTARYDGEIAYTDRELGRFMLRLEELGVLKDALVVITADHGEGLGEHDELTHGYYCYDSTTHIPLIMRGVPGVKQGTRVPGIVRNYDLAPTLVELMGVDGKGFVKQMHGVSLMPAMRDGTDLGLSAYIESHYAWLNADWAKIRGLRTRDSLTLFSGDEAIYVTDTKQNVNAAATNEKAVNEARSEINRLMNSWMPPRKGRGEVRESTFGTPYPGESAVAQDFEAEKINDTTGNPTPHAKAKILLAYQAAELEYDAERFSACAAMLRELLQTEPDFIMALKLLAAVNQGVMKAEWKQLGVPRAKELARETADSLRRVSEIERRHGQLQAADNTRRNQALMLVWLNDIKLMRELADATDDPAIDWMFHLTAYRVATKGLEAEAASDAAKFLGAQPEGLSFMVEARKDLQRMQAGEPLKLAPWEQ
jgi:arylsulfatase A-like enzyme